MERLIDELKRKLPGLTRRAQRSPLAAIRLSCLECMWGSSKDVNECTAAGCTLHRFRKGRGVPVDTEPSNASKNDESDAGNTNSKTDNLNCLVGRIRACKRTEEERGYYTLTINKILRKNLEAESKKKWQKEERKELNYLKVNHHKKERRGAKDPCGKIAGIVVKPNR